MSSPPSPDADAGDPIVLVGALHVDELYWPTGAIVPRASNPVRCARRVGGVAANVARAARDEALALAARPSAGTRAAARPVVLCAALGDDADGRWLIETLLAAGVDCRAVTVPSRSSGRYVVVHDDAGELLIGLSDVDVAETLEADAVRARLGDVPAAAVVLDANLSERCLGALLGRGSAPGSRHDAPRVALAVSPAKASRLASHLASIDLLYCNRREAAALGRTDGDAPLESLADALLAAGAARFVLSDGAAPALVQEPSERRTLPIPPVAIAGSVNGAGDALTGASLAHWLAHGDLAASVRDAGIPAARAVLSAGS